MSPAPLPRKSLSAQEALDRALGWAAIGCKVFPCQPDGQPFTPEGWDDAPAVKSPLTRRGFYDATDDVEQIAATWMIDFPGAYVGIWAGGSGLFVLDVDRKNGKDGFASIKSRGLPLGETWSTRTGNGGEHRVFSTDSDDMRPASNLSGMQGVDVRAGGSYIIAWADAPASREEFSADIPAWMLTNESRDDFSGEGFSGSVDDWLATINQETLPSSRVRDFMANIVPKGKDFDHPRMVELAWGVVRMGAEGESGIREALELLRSEWLRGEYDTPAYRRDFDLALRGAIKKAGKVQKPLPPMVPFIEALQEASRRGAKSALDAIEREAVPTSTPLEMARHRKALFEACASRGITPGIALSIVARSKSYRLAGRISIESVWFNEGEPVYARIDPSGSLERIEGEEGIPNVAAPGAGEGPISETETAILEDFHRERNAGSFLTDEEREFLETTAGRWWGDEYIDWVASSLDHFNGPYHRMLRWIVLSVIASKWGKVPTRSANPMNCSIYGMALGPSTSGKSEAWGMAKMVIDAYFGRENSPIIGDGKKTSAIALHHRLLARDGLPSMVYADEVQGFLRDLTKSHWQGTILADMSDYYGGEVPAKLMLNDKEFSGKRASTYLTAYFTGIADIALDTITLDQWIDGFFFRFLWTFSDPIEDADEDDVVTQNLTGADYTATPEAWAVEFARVKNLQEIKWGEERLVLWEEDALERMTQFNRDLRSLLNKSSLWENVYKPLNRRFSNSIMKCATLVALSEGSERVTLRHALIAIDQAWEWHSAAVLAVSETQTDPFFRQARALLDFMRKNAIRQSGETNARIQRSTVMRERRFGASAQVDQLLRQLTDEGWVIKEGDWYIVHMESGAARSHKEES